MARTARKVLISICCRAKSEQLRTACSSVKVETDVLRVRDGVEEASVRCIVERLERLVVPGEDECRLWRHVLREHSSQANRIQTKCAYRVASRGLGTDSLLDREGEESGIDSIEVAD